MSFGFDLSTFVFLVTSALTSGVFTSEIFTDSVLLEELLFGVKSILPTCFGLETEALALITSRR